MKNLFSSVIFLSYLMLNCVSCQNSDVDRTSHNVDSPLSNSTFVHSILSSVSSCLSSKSEDGASMPCFKNKFYQISEKFLRDKLMAAFSDEERSELQQYQPIMKKMIHILQKDGEGSWLDTRIFNQLKLLLDESSDNAEGRKKKNKGIGQMIMISLLSGAAVIIPLMFKVIAAVATKALIVGKVAMILSALLYFNKVSHHEHDSIHETSIRRQAMMQ